MKKFFILIAAGCMLTAIVSFTLYPDNKNTSGALPGYTGSPGDGASCVSCHSVANIMFYPPAINHNIPGGNYIPGNTYQITCNIGASGRTKFGFEFSPQDISGNLAGSMTITNPTDMQLVGTNKYMTHTTAGTSGPGGSKSWQFNWTAPAAGTGQIQLCAAFNITNNDNANSGDSIVLAVINVNEGTVGINDLNEIQKAVVFPVPASDFISILFDDDSYREYAVEIFSPGLGLIKTLNIKSAGNFEKIDVSGLGAGTYFIRLKNHNGCSETHKFVITR